MLHIGWRCILFIEGSCFCGKRLNVFLRLRKFIVYQSKKTIRSAGMWVAQYRSGEDSKQGHEHDRRGPTL